MIRRSVRVGVPPGLVRGREDRSLMPASPMAWYRARTRQAVDRYANGLVTAAEVMVSLVALAREVSDDRARGARLELTEDELAFYDALVVDPLVTDMMGEPVLAQLARELYAQVRSVTTVDWQLKDQARDRVVARVLRLLRRHGYPSDQLQAAV